MKYLLIIILLCFPTFTLSQSPLNPTEKLCENAISKTVLRGFKLGMTAAEVRKKVPEVKIPTQNRFGESETQPYWILTKSASMRRITSRVIDKGKYPNFNGLETFALNFVDSRVSQISLSYESAIEWQDAREFANIIAQKLGLPIASWETKTSDNGTKVETMPCGSYGIAIIVNKNSRGFDAPYLSILNRQMIEMVDKRVEAYEERLDELDRKEKQKFKP